MYIYIMYINILEYMLISRYESVKNLATSDTISFYDWNTIKGVAYCGKYNE